MGPVRGTSVAMTSWGWGPHMGLGLFRKRHQKDFCLSLSTHVRTWPSDNQKQFLPRTESVGTLILNIPTSGNVSNLIWWFKPPSLWFFLMAAWADYNIILFKNKMWDEVLNCFFPTPTPKETFNYFKTADL